MSPVNMGYESPRSINSSLNLSTQAHKSRFNSPGKTVDMNSPLFKTLEKKFIRNSIDNRIKSEKRKKKLTATVTTSTN